MVVVFRSPEGARFSFRFRDVVESIDRRLDTDPLLTNSALLEWLYTRRNEGTERMFVPERFTGTMKQVAASLLEDHRGLVTCPHCVQTFKATRVRREEWTGLPVAGEGGEGCRYFCPGEHLILELSDRRI